MDIFGVDDLLHEGTSFGRKIFEASYINLVDDENGRFAGEKGFYRVEEFSLGNGGLGELAYICTQWNTCTDAPVPQQYIHIAR